jgi:UDP-glucose 4-epimerase
MILITGGLGFIGVHAAAAFLKAGESVVLTKHRSSRIPNFLVDHIGSRVFVEEVDIADLKALERIALTHKVDGVVHLAAPPLSVNSLETEFRSNLLGLLAVLEVGRLAEVKRVTIGSSVAVYRGLAGGPFREDANLAIPSTIGVETFKKSFEILVDHYAKRSGLNVVCVRISSVYGPLYSSMVNAPSRIVHAAVRGVKGPLSHPMSPKTFAESSADYIFVEDCARGIQEVQLAPKLTHRTYNLGSGRATTAREFGDAVRRVLRDAEITLEDGAGPDFRPEAFEDLSRIRADVNFKPRFDVLQSIEKYIAWLRQGNDH